MVDVTFLAGLSSVSTLGIVYDVGIIVVFATIAAIITKLLKQPMILAYIVAGLIIGPIGFGIIGQTEPIRLLSELGIAFLLFTVGVESDLNKMKKIGKLILFGTGLQVILIVLFTAIFSYLLALNLLTSIYLGLILAFSSTTIVVKILSDNHHLNTLHGRLMIGFLVMQDLFVIFALPLLAGSTQFFSLGFLGMTLLKGALLVLLAFMLGRYVFSRLLTFSIKSQELMYLTAVSMCFLFIFMSYMLNFSPAVGAFLAGLSISSLSYNIELASKIKGLRDFFVTIFFVSLGMQIMPFLSSMSLGYALLLAAIMFMIVLILKPLIFIGITALGGYGFRIGVLVGLGLAQVSEFSFIIANQGLSQQIISQDIYSIIIIVTAITMTITPYLMDFSERIYLRLARYNNPFLENLFFRKKLRELEKIPEITELSKHIIVMGAGVTGSGIASALNDMHSVVVVDHDPEVVFEQINKGLKAIYGNIENDELWGKVNLRTASLLIITIPEIERSLFLSKKARNLNPNITIFSRAKSKEAALKLYEAGADYVILPDIIGSNVFIRNIMHFLETGKTLDIQNYKEEFIQYLKEETEKEENKFRL